MRLLVQHRTVYGYPTPAALGPHRIRLRPANHVRARVESYALRVPREAQIRWQQDPSGNHVAQLSFAKGTRLPELAIEVELAVEVRPVNPFDFLIDDRCEKVPFAYPPELALDLVPFLDAADRAVAAGPRFAALLAQLPASGPTVPFVVEANRLVHRSVRYVLREEPGVWTPEETLEQGRGSCRDQAVLLMALLRARGLASRFASGYLVQLADEGMIPDEPRGVSRDVVDLHAWTEVFLPGGGWIGLDPTSGLLCGEGHLPLACVARPQLAAPVEGTSDVPASSTRFEMTVGRLGHEVRPTAPFPDESWARLLEGGDAADRVLEGTGLRLTTGGEPTFNAREGVDLPEWNGAAIGPAKWEAGLRLAGELRRRFAPGGALLLRSGKRYPGESLPRWALEIVGRSDGATVWTEEDQPRGPADLAASRRVVEAIAARLGVGVEPIPAFEDPWPILALESSRPVEVDPTRVDLSDPEERRRLARLLTRGPSTPAGFVLPIWREGGAWRSEAWRFRRGHLFLLPGDAPMGLRLPLGSLSGELPLVLPREAEIEAPDPRLGGAQEAGGRLRERPGGTAAAPPVPTPVRTALCVEPRAGRVHVFLPPLASSDDFLALTAVVDAARRAAGVDVLLEGYPPLPSPALRRLSVAPDPGVVEVNVPPAASAREHAAVLEATFEAAFHAGLHSERYLLDGRMVGSGGGHHLTAGGPTPLESPFVVRPDLLASLVAFAQHHPSLSFLFTGLFVGPTSQAPRVDEARHDALYELEIALAELHRLSRAGPSKPAPWVGDLLLRHLLVDVSGNTHRAEICIDKLWDWRTPHGRQGVVELRAFEMPPHPRMAVAQAILVRTLLAALAGAPYRGRLVRWGAELHDRFLLPTWLWKDFQEVLAFLADRGLPLPEEPYRAFLELRCPVAGRIDVDGLSLEVRNALEPWPVLGEEPGSSGTSRPVDSSVERIEVRTEGFVNERHAVLVNGAELPLRPTGTAGEYVGGVRFRAWAQPHSLQPHLGVHHPLRLEMLDRWARRSVGACAYHVWHPEGRAFDTPPLTRFEAAARRAQRFTAEGPSRWPVHAVQLPPHPDMPYTLDLRRHPGDRPVPAPEREGDEA